LTGYLAAEGFVAELREELGDVAAEHGRLLLAPGPPRRAAWAQNVWLDPVELRFGSIREAATALRGIQRNWVLYSHVLHRRAHLVEAELPRISFKPLHFGDPPPAAPLGSWTLLEAGRLLASARCSSPFPHGEVQFV